MLPLSNRRCPQDSGSARCKPVQAGPLRAPEGASPFRPPAFFDQPVKGPLCAFAHAAAARLRLPGAVIAAGRRSEEHTSELQSLMRISYAVFCLKKKNHSTMYSTNNSITHF